MNKDLQSFLSFLEGEIGKFEKTTKFIDLDELKKIAFDISGSENHIAWHLYFNLDKLKDKNVIFSPTNNTNYVQLSSFSRKTNRLFEELEKKTGFHQVYLKCMFNDFLINKK